MHSMSEPLKAQAKIILVDDHPVVLEGLTTLIEREPDLVVCAKAENSHEALQKIEKFVPDLVVIDLSLNGGGGLELIKQIKSLWPAMAMLVLSVHEESVYAERALRAGARGYVMKQMATVALLSAIRRVLAEGLSVSDQVSKGFVERMITGQAKAAKQSPIETLSDRELEVFDDWTWLGHAGNCQGSLLKREDRGDPLHPHQTEAQHQDESVDDPRCGGVGLNRKTIEPTHAALGPRSGKLR